MISKIPFLLDLVNNITLVSVPSNITGDDCGKCSDAEVASIEEKSVIKTLLTIGGHFNLAKATDFSQSTAVHKATLRVVNARLKAAEKSDDENSVSLKSDLVETLRDVCKDETSQESDAIAKLARGAKVVAREAKTLGKAVWK